MKDQVPLLQPRATIRLTAVPDESHGTFELGPESTKKRREREGRKEFSFGKGEKKERARKKGKQRNG